MPPSPNSIKTTQVFGPARPVARDHLKTFDNPRDRSAEVHRLVDFAIAHGALEVTRPKVEAGAAKQEPDVDHDDWVGEA